MRKSGKTTRMVDVAIQELFTKGSIYIPTKSHLEGNIKDYGSIKKNTNYIVDPDWNKGMAQRELFQLILKRLESEHNLGSNLMVNTRENTIQLIDFKN